jgi:hypothetical protein
MATFVYTGQATSQVDLLNQLDTTLVAEGWTKDGGGTERYNGEDYAPYDAESAAWPDGRTLHVHKTNSYGDVQYFHFYACYQVFPWPDCPSMINSNNWADNITYNGMTQRQSQVSGLICMGSSGYNSGASEWWDQTEPVTSMNKTNPTTQPCGVILPKFTGQPINYWFYFLGDSVHIVVEMWTGVFNHMSFGTIKKAFGFTGGQYCAGYAYDRSDYDYDLGTGLGTGADMCWTPNLATGGGGIYSPTAFVYAEVGETADNYWNTMNSAQQNNVTGKIYCDIPIYHQAMTVNKGPFGHAMRYCPSTLTNLTAQWPLYLSLGHTPNAQRYYLGYPEGIRFVNMKGLTSKQTSVFGPDTWRLFPQSRIDPSQAGYATCVPGLSYKESTT